jgi:hypothetical protein
VIPSNAFADSYNATGSTDAGTNGCYNLGGTHNGNNYYINTISGEAMFVSTVGGTRNFMYPSVLDSNVDYIGVGPVGDYTNTWNANGQPSPPTVTYSGSSCSSQSSQTINRLAKFIATSPLTFGDSLLSDDGANMTLTAGNLLMQMDSLIDTVTNGALNFGTATATTMTFGRSGQNAIFNSNVGIGTSTPGSPFSIQNIANFTTATTTFYGSGINLTSGCFAVNGVCVGSASGGVSSIAQTYGTGQTGAITFATSSTAYNGLTVNERITNSGSAFTFSPILSGTLGIGGGGTASTTPLGGILVGNGSNFIKSLIVGNGLFFNGTTLAVATSTNCSSSASPAVCGSAPSGSVAVATGGSTLVVNTTAVTANSQILITEDSSLVTRLGIACNTTTGRVYSISARTAGTSFTIKSSANPATNKACLSYWIVN